MNRIEKNRKIEAVKCWITNLSYMDEYNQRLLAGYNGDELDKMTGTEVEMILNYIKAVYHHAFQRGAEITRKKGWE